MKKIPRRRKEKEVKKRFKLYGLAENETSWARARGKIFNRT